MSCKSQSRTYSFTPEEIAILAKHSFPSLNVEIVDFDLQPYSKDLLGYLGVHEILKIETRHKKDYKTLTFFVKSLTPSGNAFERMLQREETAFYREVLPRLLETCETKNPWVAKCYLAREDVLVLEDLKTVGFQTTDKQLKLNELRSAAVCLAQFHASSILLEAKLKKPLDSVFGEFFKEKIFISDNGMNTKWLQTGIEVVEAVAQNLGLNYRHVSKAYEIVIETIRPVKCQRNVLAHSDLWSNNLMFTEDRSQCRLVDFQMVAYMHYAVDLVQLIYLTTNRESRLKFERHIIEHYHTALNECLRKNGVSDNKIINLDEVYKDVEEKRICGLVTAVQLTPIMLFNKETAYEFTKDPKKMYEYKKVSRKDFVLKAMQADAHYRVMIENFVEDLIEFMENWEAGDQLTAK